MQKAAKEAEANLLAIKHGKPHRTVLVQAHHRWGKDADSARRVASNWQEAEIQSVAESITKVSP